MQYSFLCSTELYLCSINSFVVPAQSAEGSISLWGFDSVRAVQRDSCAWPHTFELVNSRTLQQDHTHTLAKYDIPDIIV